MHLDIVNNSTVEMDTVLPKDIPSASVLMIVVEAALRPGDI